MLFGYRKLFDELEAFAPESFEVLEKLALCMTETKKFFNVNPPTPPKLNETADKSAPLLNSENPENLSCSSIPAGYTYLGQFITHDISFDERSNRFEAMHYPWENIPQSTQNLRRPFLDLETIYGREAQDINSLTDKNSSRLKLDNTLKNLSVNRSFPNDLPRKKNTVEADILDTRNDENLLLAQTQVAFAKFHNAIVYKLGNPNSTEVFEMARKITIRHYQYIVLNDFLPKLVQADILKNVISEVRNETNKLYLPTQNDLFLPSEFSVGAYRTAHSMIKSLYNLNKHRKADLREIFLFTGRGFMDFTERKNLPSNWIINWKWFYDINNSRSTDAKFFNFAKKITTKFAKALGRLEPGTGNDGRSHSLSALDLYRGVAWRLPSGQKLAEEIGKKYSEIRILKPEQIESKLGEPLSSAQTNYLKQNTPLLFYLLAEAEEQCEGEKLGDVGSRIVAETLVKLIYETPDSILKSGQELENDKDFLPNDNEIFEMLGTTDRKIFGMPEMLKFIAESRKKFAITPEENFDELNPLG